MRDAAAFEDGSSLEAGANPDSALDGREASVPPPEAGAGGAGSGGDGSLPMGTGGAGGDGSVAPGSGGLLGTGGTGQDGSGSPATGGTGQSGDGSPGTGGKAGDAAVCGLPFAGACAAGEEGASCTVVPTGNYYECTCGCTCTGGTWSCGGCCDYYLNRPYTCGGYYHDCRCPSAPSGGLGCEVLGGQTCSYGTTACLCDPGTRVWNCAVCPAAEPAAAAACTVENQGCVYGGGARYCACDGGAWSCLDTVCTPSSSSCSPDLLGIDDCNASGSGVTPSPCSSDRHCEMGSSAPACVLDVCPQGALYCDGTSLRQCDPAGASSTLVEDCAATQELCVAGACAAATVDQQSEGSTALNPTGEWTFGQSFAVTTARTLVVLDVELDFAGVRTLTFVVYESSTGTGSYSLTNQFARTVTGTGRAFYGTGLVSVPLVAGHSYVVGVHFTGSTTGVPVSSTSALSFGTYGYAVQASGPLPASVTPSSFFPFRPVTRMTTEAP